MSLRRIPETPGEDWYLRDWLAHFGKRQASMVNELGWNKAQASYIFHSRQPYREEEVRQLAAWLGIRPYELLMPPSEAMALRRIRDAARIIAAADSSD